MVKKIRPFLDKSLSQNPSNSGNILTDHAEDNPELSPKGKVQRLVERRTPKQVETGGTLKGFDIVWSYMKNISSSVKERYKVSALI